MKSFAFKVIAAFSLLFSVGTIYLICYGIYSGSNESDRVLQGLILQPSLIIQYPGAATFSIAIKLMQFLFAYLFFVLGKRALKKSRLLLNSTS